MRLKSITIEDFRGIRFLQLPLEPDLTVLHGENAAGKTSILSAIAVGLGIIPKLLADDRRAEFKRSDVRNDEFIAKINLETLDGLSWQRSRIEFGDAKTVRQYDDPRTQKQLRDTMDMLRKSVNAGDSVTLPVFAYYDTDRAVFELPQRRRDFREKFTRPSQLR
jgi:predicted ATP-binding protein involved in virulence